MNALLSPDTFDFVARYFLAGYFIIAIRARYVAGLRPKPTEVIAEAVILSLINQAVFAVGIFILSLCVNLDVTIKTSLGALIFEVIILPIVLGLILGWNLQKGWGATFLRKLSMPIVHPTERAWDYAFGYDRDAGFVILTLSNGSFVNGYFGQASFAATDTATSDIFLERLYSVDDDGNWTELVPRRSGWFRMSNVNSIEFVNMDGGNP